MILRTENTTTIIYIIIIIIIVAEFKKCRGRRVNRYLGMRFKVVRIRAKDITRELQIVPKRSEFPGRGQKPQFYCQIMYTYKPFILS